MDVKLLLSFFMKYKHHLILFAFDWFSLVEDFAENVASLYGIWLHASCARFGPSLELKVLAEHQHVALEPFL